jgi:hypothetical protein
MPAPPCNDGTGERLRGYAHDNPGDGGGFRGIKGNNRIATNLPNSLIILKPGKIADMILIGEVFRVLLSFK